MICRSPYTGGVAPVGCGQCLPCRIKKRREWTHRCLIEMLAHPKGSCFVTLTYSPRLYPYDGSLQPKHLQHFLRSLRRAVSPTRFRFYGCGEYGEKNGAPHYHLSLFGLGPEFAPLIQKTWSLGYTSTYEFNELTAQYVAGYVTKKMTKASDVRLDGRYPEFPRMSLRPGIGALSLLPISDAIHTTAGLDYLQKLEDVPDRIIIGGKSMLLGRYLRQKLREEIGMPQGWQARAKQNGVDAANAEVLALQESLKPSSGYLTKAQAIVKANEGRAALMESFATLSVKKGSL